MRRSYTLTNPLLKPWALIRAIGSYSSTHNHLRRLQECAREAGYMRTVDGRETIYKARVQMVIINALTSTGSWVTRGFSLNMICLTMI